MPQWCSMAPRSLASWRPRATLFRMTPAMGVPGSKVRQPWTIAAAVRPIRAALTTSRMGAASVRATAAVLPKESSSQRMALEAS